MRSPKTIAGAGSGRMSSVTPRRRASERSTAAVSRTTSFMSKGLPLDLVLRQQRTQAADHLAGAEVVAADVGEDRAQLSGAVGPRREA